jgi:hypothetical protein
MRRRLHIKWQLGRAYFYHPWHDGLPTFRDWLALIFGAAVIIVAFRQYIELGEQAGWQIAVSAFAAEAWKEIKESWHG